MTDPEIDDNVGFQRACHLLERFETVHDLAMFWRLAGTCKWDYPWPDRITPWWGGLEHTFDKQ